MPPLSEQVSLPDAFTADFTVVRVLLSCGRTYEQAVKTFEPYQAYNSLTTLPETECVRSSLDHFASSNRRLSL